MDQAKLILTEISNIDQIIPKINNFYKPDAKIDSKVFRNQIVDV